MSCAKSAPIPANISPPRPFPGLRSRLAPKLLLLGTRRCPSLRRLWLFSNRIAVAEGLHHCGALRELWLHDNKITKATGLESLVHLQVKNSVYIHFHPFRPSAVCVSFSKQVAHSNLTRRSCGCRRVGWWELGINYHRLVR